MPVTKPGRDRPDDLQHDVRAGGADGLGESGAGVPRHRRPGGVSWRRRPTRSRPAHNQYAPGIGIPPLRQAIARHQQRHYGIELDPDPTGLRDDRLHRSGRRGLLGLVEPGDEVVVLEPYYDSYVAMLQMAGAVRRPVTLRAPDFRLDADELRAAITPRTRFVLLNTPTTRPAPSSPTPSCKRSPTSRSSTTWS